MTAAAPNSTGALAGIKVLDLTRVLAGPICTMTLGDMGADVIKLEAPGSGDDTRGWGPPFAGSESAYFLGLNRNKRGLTLNLRDPRGQDLLRRLIHASDVVVENFKQGTLDKWGCGRDFMDREAGHVVHCSITGYGARGPKAALPGYDFLMQAECGLMSITGEPDGEPMKYGVAIVDVCTGLYAAITILAALQARAAGAPGQHVEVSLYTTGLAMLVNVAANVLVSGKGAGRYGNGHPNIVPYRSYRCRDAELALAVGNDAQFANFARAVGHPEWADDPDFATNRARVVNRDRIDGMIGEVMATRDADQWIETLLAVGVPCGRINSVEEALAAPQTAAMDMVVEMANSAAGRFRALGLPFRFSATPAAVRRPPPVLGEHTHEILAEFLDLSADEVEALRADGVV